jgi:putative ABC transport system permease protein
MAFYLTYLRRELRRRARQALLIAAGLGLGVGLVMTVSAASAGVSRAQNSVLRSLYGVGTQLTVAEPLNAPGALQESASSLSGTLEPLQPDLATSIARLPHVASASGGLQLAELTRTGTLWTRTTVDGVAVDHGAPGPLAATTTASGRVFDATDGGDGAGVKEVAVVDLGYATANGLSVGSSLKVAGTTFKVIGIIGQSQAAGSADVYIPLGAAQSLARTPDGKPFADHVNVIYATADDASHVAGVQREVSRLLPTATVTSAEDTASAVTGSLHSADDLLTHLGRWVAIAALAAAVSATSLLTIAGVTRRVCELGTLKALGWSAGRITRQIMGESVVTGLIGAALGIATGFAGSALVSAAAPALSATAPRSNESSQNTTITVDLTAHADAALVAGTALLAMLGAVLGGAFAAWRAARLQPAAAFTRVA